MKKIAITYIIIMIAFVSVVAIIINNALDRVSEEEKKFSQPVGEQVIMNKDTLTITDYSMWNSTYKLNDESTISAIYYNKLKTKGYVIETD